MLGHAHVMPSSMIARACASTAICWSSWLSFSAASALLHRRYGWQWNIVPLLRLPGITNVHAHLPLREKLHRARAATLWADSAIIRVDLGSTC